MDWKRINIPKHRIVTETDKATLFKMPNNSEWKEYVFWHPQKLILTTRKAGSVTIRYKDNFIFRLKKYGKGKYNKYEIVATADIKGFEIAEAFGGEVKNPYETHKPEILTLQEVKILEELKDD